MKITVENLGALRHAEFTLGDLTIICGNNNTGKTYATYALYGFLMFWRDDFAFPVESKLVSALLEKGRVAIDLEALQGASVKNALIRASEEYNRRLANVFASKEKYFESSKFRASLTTEPQIQNESYERVLGTAKRRLLKVSKAKGADVLEVSLLKDVESGAPDAGLVRYVISSAIKDIFFRRIVPNPFIASAERTGAAIFRKELDFARNRLLEQMSAVERKDIDLLEALLKARFGDYALPVRHNVDFTRDLENIVKEESFVLREHAEVLNGFEDIIGGGYIVKKEELYFRPKDQRSLKLTMDESSSAVRSLLDIGFYLRHIVQKNDLFIVDEPELNLHPENQRKVARLLARLVNLGVKVFITTHSDYIIKELNTLIMLNHDHPEIKQICEEVGYVPQELLAADNVRVYIAEKASVPTDNGGRPRKKQTLIPADIDQHYGIEVKTFDETIDKMNDIQSMILSVDLEEVDG